MSDVNPYASPVSVDPLEPFPEAGVGAWRDGSLLVMHKDAELPAMCVKSGRPATHWCRIKILLREPLTLWSRTAQVELPLSQRWRALHVRGQWLMFWLGGVLVMPVVLAIAFAQQLPHEKFQILLLLNVLAAAISILTGLGFRRLLEPVQTKGDYVWLYGAGRKFLAQLPPWPYGK